MLRAAWKAVGASVMPEPDIRHLAGTLFTGDDGEGTIRRIDRRIGTLPGLDGLGLLTGAFARYAA